MVFALIGNQNSGKTTLFNQLTGANQHVGNFPGVTVEKKEGRIKGYRDVSAVDLPGIYSLSPYSAEELVSRNFLLKEHPDAIIDIVDATNIERNLYLTLQLMEIGVPMVVALNMMDEVQENGDSIDITLLEQELGIPVLPIVASKREGIEDLIDRAVAVAKGGTPPLKLDFCTAEVHKAIHSVSHLVEEKARRLGYTPRFVATKFLENDEPMAETMALSEADLDIINHIAEDMEESLGTDREAAIVDMRYSYIEDLCERTVKRKKEESAAQMRSYRIDSILTHKYLAIPLFIGIMAFIFYLTFGPIGTFLADGFSGLVDGGIGLIDQWLAAAGVSTWLHSLLVDGALSGIGAVMSFLPVILLLFFFLSILEDTGYMARVAFVMDRALRNLGLSGHSCVPMLIGFGCSVPAILSTRTLYSENDRKISIFLVPFMSCSAKLPIYGLFTAAFFPGHKWLVMTILYVTGMAVAVLSALMLRNTAFRGKPVPFLLELPAYRFPTVKSVALHIWDKAKDFLQRAFTIIFIASLVVWVLSSLDFTFNMVEDNSTSILAQCGRVIAPVFRPLGFGDWRMVSALITGLTAKETVVSTLTVLAGTGTEEALIAAMSSLFTPLSAAAFLGFVLLYMPCVAAFAATRRELGSMRLAVCAMGYQTIVAWIIGFLIFGIGHLFGLG